MSATLIANVIQQLPVPVRTHFRAFSVPASVHADRYSRPASQFGPERRREVRYATCDAVEVSVLDVPGFQVRGVLRDVSKNGLRVELGLPVEPGARLRIVLRDRAIIFAAACYCRNTGRSFQVGAAIKGVYHPKSTGEPIGTDLLLPSGVWHDEPASTPGTGKPQPNRDLAQAIIDDHMSAGATGSHRMPPFSDAGV
jgi:PilZ domain